MRGVVSLVIDADEEGRETLEEGGGRYQAKWEQMGPGGRLRL